MQIAKAVKEKKTWKNKFHPFYLFIGSRAD